MTTHTAKRRGFSLFNLDFSRLFGLGQRQGVNLSDVLTPFKEALEELRLRQENTELRERVHTFLKEDIPEHFRAGPILYLARHVASPNFETLRFVHLTDPLDLPAVIGQDTKDRFVSRNPLKRALGKLPISIKITRKNNVYHEVFQNVSITDFNVADGQHFTEIQTFWGQNLVAFHNELFSLFSHHSIKIVDDSPWIDRHHRGNLFEHYKHLLVLFLVHGILFEDYLPEDKEEESFLKNVLLPAFNYVEKTFGYRPLIVRLTPTSVESPRFWISYPAAIKQFVQTKLKNPNHI